MTGAPPSYNAQSPTQQSHYGPYSSPTKSHPYYPVNEQYQHHPSQTPPAFPPSSLSRSPHFSHGSSPMPGSLPPMNGAAPPPQPHPDHPSQYQSHPPPGTPHYTLPRPFSGTGSALSPNGGPQLYNHSNSPHAHPSTHHSNHSQSPQRDQESRYAMGGDRPGYPGSMIRESRPASPPKESVRSLLLMLGIR